MQVNQFFDLVEALQFLSAEGFTKSFTGRSNKLYCLKTGQFVDPEPLAVVCYYHFKGGKNLGDISAVYAVSGKPIYKV